MIGILFKYGTELIEVVIDNNSLLFQTKQTGSMLAPIDSLKLDKAGCIKEHPDLKDRKDWREESIKRLKDKLKKMKTEKEKTEYVISELSKKGYTPYMMRKAGHRAIKFK